MRALLPCVVFVLLAVPTVPATHGPAVCPQSEGPSIGIIEFGDGDPSRTFYLDADEAGDLVIYQESNGVYGADLDADGDVDTHDNLQRDAGHSILWGHDGCVDHSFDLEPDLKLFDSGVDI